jgi:hypothetical protein
MHWAPSIPDALEPENTARMLKSILILGALVPMAHVHIGGVLLYSSVLLDTKGMCLTATHYHNQYSFCMDAVFCYAAN